MRIVRQTAVRFPVKSVSIMSSKQDVLLTDLQKQILLNRIGYGQVYQFCLGLLSCPQSRVLIGDDILCQLRDCLFSPGCYDKEI